MHTRDITLAILVLFVCWNYRRPYVLATIGVIITGILTTLFIFQNKLLYIPKVGDISTVDSNPKGMRCPAEVGLDSWDDLTIQTSDGFNLHGWLIRQKTNGPVIVFCHGNAGNMGLRMANFHILFHGIGISILAFDYRGFGNSTGIPTEAGLLEDGISVMRFLSDNVDLHNGNVVIFGRSLGGAVALAMTKEYEKNRDAYSGFELKGLIIENTFLCVRRMFSKLFPIIDYEFIVRHLLRNHWDNEKTIVDIKTPILFVAGDQDELVPHNHMIKLHSLAKCPENELFVVKGGTHNDTWYVAGDLYTKTIGKFVRQHCEYRPRDQPKN